MDAYVARQPIFDNKKSLFAYELLFRDGLNNWMPEIDGDTATSKVLSSSFFTIGMDKITAGKRAFINFTQNLLSTAIPFMFPSETTVIEILEDVNPEPLVIETCRRLSDMGYCLALDDFVLKSQSQPLIEFADIIKIDFLATPVTEIKKYLQTFRPKRIRFLAEKIETNQEFKSALNMGFELFQGYFFSRPRIKGREISSSTMQFLKFMIEINKPNYDLNELEAIISRDLSISYKLLRYVNSVFFKKGSDITSLKQALLVLGNDELRRLVSLIGLSKLASNKPDELVKSACIKAKLCEKMCSLSSHATSCDELFMLGLFSNLDAILDQPMNEIMAKLPLSNPIKEALVHRQGDLAAFLRLSEYYERAEWQKVKEYAQQIGIAENMIPNIFIEACSWANELEV